MRVSCHSMVPIIAAGLAISGQPFGHRLSVVTRAAGSGKISMPIAAGNFENSMLASQLPADPVRTISLVLNDLIDVFESSSQPSS